MSYSVRGECHKLIVDIHLFVVAVDAQPFECHIALVDRLLGLDVRCRTLLLVACTTQNSTHAGQEPRRLQMAWSHSRLRRY